RVEHQTKTSTWRMAPRLGIAWTPSHAAGIVVRSGFGVFYDRVPLSVYAFSQYPEQIVTSYDASGRPVGAPRHYLNLIATQIGSRCSSPLFTARAGATSMYSTRLSPISRRCRSGRTSTRICQAISRIDFFHGAL